jgi:hypothetical protein
MPLEQFPYTYGANPTSIRSNRAMLSLLRSTPLDDFWKQQISNCDMFHFTVRDGKILEMPMILQHRDPFDVDNLRKTP